MKSLLWEEGGGRLMDGRTGPRHGWQLKLLIKIIQTLLPSNRAEQSSAGAEMKSKYFQMKMTNLQDNDVSERLKISSQTLIVLRSVH